MSKISELSSAATLDGDESVPVVQDGETVRTTVQDVADLVSDDLDEVRTTVGINSQSDDYTLVAGDAGKVIRVTAEADITVPPSSSVPWEEGTIINVRAATSGTVAVVEGAGVTINTPETLTLKGQWSEVSLHYVDSDEWDLVGDVEDA